MYTLWYYTLSRDGRLTKAYDIMSGSRYACYKRRRQIGAFSWQYKVERA